LIDSLIGFQQSLTEVDAMGLLSSKVSAAKTPKLHNESGNMGQLELSKAIKTPKLHNESGNMGQLESSKAINLIDTEEFFYLFLKHLDRKRMYQFMQVCRPGLER
jgi:hypothetical protein